MKKEPHLLPDISGEYIEDKGKANGLARLLVCFQASWFCIQGIIRMTQSLPISLLELKTFAHSICTLVIFYFWWDKPLNIEEPTRIFQEKIRPLAPERNKYKGPYPLHLSASTVSRWRLATVARHQYRIDTDHIGGEGVEANLYYWPTVIAFVFAPAIYGSIHVVAWYMVFPTYAEKILWRMSVCFVMTASLLWALERLYKGEDDNEYRRKYDDILMGDGTV
ncbi:hypothetical protein GQ44DRAFT_659612, partial [Phaeosphaeriaceae sp. PMI808]